MNRRRLTGHRSDVVATPFGIRAPWAVYETADGVSATGHGPSLNTWTALPAPVGEGLNGSKFVTSSPGISTASDFSLGYFVQVTAENISDALTFSSSQVFDDGSKRYRLSSFNAEATVITIDLTDNNGVEHVTFNVDSPTIGFHHLGVSVSSGIATLFWDGIAVGTPSAVGTSATVAARTAVAFNSNDGLGSPSGAGCQFIYAAVAYSSPEWRYIYNNANGRLYSTWNILP